MCGLAGERRFDGERADTDAVARMTARMSARGPDGEGVVTAGPLALGHRRLKIIDLSDAGSQPMTNDELGLPDLFAAGVDICGMVDFESFYARTEPWIAALAVTKYGDPVMDRELLRALSPLHRMDRLAAPLLVVHGSQDTNVPVHEAEQTVAAAQRAGVPVRYLLFEGEGHELARVENRNRFVTETVAWLTKHLETEASAA